MQFCFSEYLRKYNLEVKEQQKYNPTSAFNHLLSNYL